MKANLPDNVAPTSTQKEWWATVAPHTRLQVKPAGRQTWLPEVYVATSLSEAVQSGAVEGNWSVCMADNTANESSVAAFLDFCAAAHKTDYSSTGKHPGENTSKDEKHSSVCSLVGFVLLGIIICAFFALGWILPALKALPKCSDYNFPFDMVYLLAMIGLSILGVRGFLFGASLARKASIEAIRSIGRIPSPLNNRSPQALGASPVETARSDAKRESLSSMIEPALIKLAHDAAEIPPGELAFFISGMETTNRFLSIADVLAALESEAIDPMTEVQCRGGTCVRTAGRVREELLFGGKKTLPILFGVSASVTGES